MHEAEGRRFQLPSATTALLLVNLGFFVFQNINAVYLHWPVLRYLALSREGLEAGWFWQLFTFQFLHGGTWHFVCNVVGLYFLGRPLEAALGPARLLEVYFGGSFLGGLLQALLGLLFPFQFGQATLGASAGVCGLLAAFAMLQRDRMFLFMFFLPIRAWNLLLISLGVAVFFVLVPSEPGIAHAAHLGGLLGGMAYVHWIVRAERRLFDWRPYRDHDRDAELVHANATTPPARRRRDPAGDEELPESEFISREVDPILDKISAQGLQSLTDRERRILEKARAKMLRGQAVGRR
jgi:membrane associated rhomboid family serine protease